jgi:hypothetical protein
MLFQGSLRASAARRWWYSRADIPGVTASLINRCSYTQVFVFLSLTFSRQDQVRMRFMQRLSKSAIRGRNQCSARAS